ncbi:ABC transporter substrate-binding protein [Bifidobacterium sp. ESL0682]|uniref:ABC transporter substrate-binding protein n=1 Tax=Bifidobacterium sp. ESL0682 TaxID=2983212 RepID=UPI0023F8A3BC|nr:ABC transporter substrate-binding protein [Bifidobacterium sp. ESL0682]WEV42420.1 ABC transporter substrate-binding protein [Bifidobacterium sp. ESL0682]
MKYRKVLAAFTAVAALASLAACGGVKKAADTSDSTITVGTTDKVINLDPAAAYDNGSYNMHIQMYPFLFAPKYNSNELSPDIAADDGTWSADGTQFTVKIKPGLKFANGHTLDSKDVKFSIDRVKNINDPNGPSSILVNIKSVQAPNPTTVVFTSAVPHDVTLKQSLSTPAGPIVDDQVFSATKATSADDIIKANAFAGPYRLTQYKPDEMAVFEKNPSYKGLTPAKNKTVQVKFFSDTSNLKMAVEKGDVKVASRSLTPTDIQDLKKSGKVKVLKGPGGEERFITFNFLIQPYGEKTPNANSKEALAVRQAVADLVDRQEIASKVYKGTYTPMYSYVPSGMMSHTDTLKAAYGDGKGGPSLEKAKKTLNEAGVKTPVNLKLQYNGDHYGSSSADEYAAIKSQLEAGGLFKVDLQQTEWGQYNKDRVVTKDSDGSYPAYQMGWYPSYSDPDNYLSPFFRAGNFVNNGYKNDAISGLIAKQAGEQDQDKRVDMLKQIQQMETQDLSTLPLLQGNQMAVTAPGIKGVTFDTASRFRYAPITNS